MRYRAMMPAIVIVMLAACGGDGATQPGDELSADQVQSMARSLRTLFALSIVTEDARIAPSARLATLGTLGPQPINGTRACPQGGYIGVDGTFGGNDSGDIVFAISDTLVACGIKDKEQNVWTFTTKPTLELSIIEAFEGDSTDVPILTVRESDVGRVNFSVGSTSGTCSMNVAVQTKFLSHSPTADSMTTTLHTTGTLCGRSIASDTSLTIFAPPLP
jgi:hypothetical protein